MAAGNRQSALTFNLYGKSNDTYDFKVDFFLVLKENTNLFVGTASTTQPKTEFLDAPTCVRTAAAVAKARRQCLG